MPSHGSLQQAVKVRPERGKGERREGEKKAPLSGFLELFLLRHKLRNVLPRYLGNGTDLYSPFALSAKSVPTSVCLRCMKIILIRREKHKK